MKKNKKAAPEDTQIKKDYQQEIDPDVKQGEKGKKALIGVVAFIVVFFVAILGWYISDNSVKEQPFDVNGKTAQQVIAQGEESEDEIIEVDGSLLDLTKESVEVTIPLEYFNGEDVKDTLDENQIAGGYLDVKKADGAVVYTLKTSYYPSIIENLYEYNEKTGDAYEKKNGVELVSCNKYGTVFTVTVDKAGYKPNAHYDMLEKLYYDAAIYQCYLGVKPENISTNFQMKYLHEQFTFTDYPFPSCLGKNLNTIAMESQTTTTTADSTENEQ